MNNDLISRSELKKAINKIIDEEIEIEEKWARGLKYSLKIIDNAPTVPLPDFKDGYKQAIIDGKTNFQRPKGEWIERTERITLDTYYECSNCKEPWTTIEGTPWQNMMNFCPNCGARMKGNKAGKGNDNE